MRGKLGSSVQRRKCCSGSAKPPSDGCRCVRPCFSTTSVHMDVHMDAYMNARASRLMVFKTYRTVALTKHNELLEGPEARIKHCASRWHELDTLYLHLVMRPKAGSTFRLTTN